MISCRLSPSQALRKRQNRFSVNLKSSQTSQNVDYSGIIKQLPQLNTFKLQGEAHKNCIHMHKSRQHSKMLSSWPWQLRTSCERAHVCAWQPGAIRSTVLQADVIFGHKCCVHLSAHVRAFMLSERELSGFKLHVLKGFGLVKKHIP